MNVCNEGGPLVIFREERAARSNPKTDHLKPASDDGWVDYCRAREASERAAAKRAASITARRVHQELAQAYARRVREWRPG